MKKIPVLLVSLVLAACGGGGGGGSAGSDSSGVPVAVVDGAIKNATVCLDKNSNGACDAGEPSAKTDASGNAVLTVSNTDKGQYPVIAVVGTDATDADTGAVSVAYTMKAPKDQTAVVSPLTTLVQVTVESTGVSTATAAATVQSQTGLNISPFTNFTTDPTNADNKAAQIVANAVVVTTQQQSSTISSAVGSSTSDGSKVTQADIDKLVAQKVMELLPQILEAAADSTIQSGTATERVAALKVKANAILATDGITSASAATAAVDVNKQAASSSSTTYTPSAYAHLRNLVFTDANNWYARISSATLDQDTPVNNVVKYQFSRFQRVAGADVYSWYMGSKPARGSDLHWNGTAWVNCTINNENTSTVRDSNGFGSYNYCDGLEKGSSQRTATISIAGKKMIDVYNDLRAAGYTNLTIGSTATSAASLLGSVTFPAGNSQVRYSSGMNTDNAVGYYAGTDNTVYLPGQNDGGGDYTVSGSSTACNGAGSTQASRLEDLVAKFTGNPCKFGQGSVTVNGTTYKSLNPNESWFYASLSLGTIGSAATYTSVNSNITSYYTTNIRLRVAFASTANSTIYYSCKERWDGSSRNCTAIGTGTYAIQTLGDGSRIMTFNGLPSIASAQDFTRVFVERGGKIYFGYQNRATVNRNAAFNTPAAAALLDQLGIKSSIPTLDTSVKLALTKLSYAASWSGTYTGSTDNGTFSFTLYSDGTSSCSVKSAASSTSSTCTVNTLTPRASDSTVADISLGSVSTGATFTGTVSYYTGAVSGTWSNSTATGCTTTACTGAFTGSRI